MDTNLSLSLVLSLSRRVQSDRLSERKDAIVVLAHGKVVVGPVLAANVSMAKGLASKKAKEVLSDETSELSLRRLCDCMVTDAVSDEEDLPPSPSELSDETEEGFAQAAQIVLNEALKGELDHANCGDVTEEEAHDDTEQQEVEMILCTPSQMSSAMEGMSIVLFSSLRQSLITVNSEEIL